jgi:DNA-directed RNA polymerase I, II, and III subunit RPABC2
MPKSTKKISPKITKSKPKAAAEVKEESSEYVPEDTPDAEANADADADVDSSDELPSLDYVTKVAKERYEYRPVIRTQIVYKLPADRVTSEVMSKFELCEVISIRARQLEICDKVFTDIADLTNPLDIARKEIRDRKCPLDIIRMITETIAERWHVNEMAIPPDMM